MSPRSPHLMRQHRPNDKAGAGNRELPPMFEGWSEKVGDNRIDEGAVGTPSAYANEQRLRLAKWTESLEG